MPFRRATRVLASWMAVLAILAAVLAPSISQALGAERSADWIEICTTAGARWVQPESENRTQKPAPDAAHPLEHCPYCSLHTDALDAPPAPMAVLPALAQSAVLPSTDAPAAHARDPRLGAQPRAPPRRT